MRLIPKHFGAPLILAAVAATLVPTFYALPVAATTVPTLSVTGIAQTPDGAPLRSANVVWSLLPADSPTPRQPAMLAQTFSTADGSFTLSVPMATAVSYALRQHLNTILSVYHQNGTTTATAGTWAIPFKDATGSGILVPMESAPVVIPTQTLPLNTTPADVHPCVVGTICYLACQVQCPPEFPQCYAPQWVSIATTQQYTTINEVHAGADMTVSLTDTYNETNEVSLGASGDGQNWNASGYAALSDDKGGGNFVNETGPWGTTADAKFDYTEHQFVYTCGTGATQYQVTPDRADAGIGPGADRSSNDTFGNYVASDNQRQMTDLGWGSGTSKNTGNTKTYAFAATVWGFGVSSKSQYSSNMAYSWKSGTAYPEYSPAHQWPYHVWGDNGSLADSQTAYSYAGNDHLTGTGTFQTQAIYSQPGWTQTPANCTPDQFSFAATSNVVLVPTFATNVPAYNGTVTFQASGGASCAGSIEAGSITLNPSLGNGPSGQATTCAAFSGSYIVNGTDLQINTLGSGCTVNGVPTGLMKLTGSGTIAPQNAPSYNTAIWSVSLNFG